jgi:cytidylate kinase
MHSNIIVAIDGYSSCGKSTLAQALAKKLNFIYVDSGAMYRAVTVYMLRNEVDITDLAKVHEALEQVHVNFEARNDEVHVLLNDEEITEEIRQMHVSEKVSQVATLKEVRHAMVKQQQRMGRSKHIVMDGRDIGTAVFPDANVKLFMTADPIIRAERRYKELRAKGEDITMEEIMENLSLRDYQDTTRVESPLIQAEDAIVLDNSNLTQEEQLEFALEHVKPFLKK